MDSPGPGLAAFTAMDAGDADIIVTQSADVAQWADKHGYVVRAAAEDEVTIYEIWPGDSGPDDPIVRLDL